MNKLEIFLNIFMCDLEFFLNEKKEELSSLTYQIDEANVDRSLKEYLKQIIENEHNKIIKFKNIKFINYENTKQEVLGIENYYISNVFLPNEITEELKLEFKKNNTEKIYTNPDIVLEIIADGKKYHIDVEIKTTKNNYIPGSSIQQISERQWVIFIQHKGNDLNVSIGRYIDSLSSKIQFPDRSPRPEVSFLELKKWNEKNRKILKDEIIFNVDENRKIKKEIINDWQDFLAKRWLKIIFENNNIKANEPWFNNNIRKFVYLFLLEYEKLTDEEKENLLKKIKNEII